MKLSVGAKVWAKSWDVKIVMSTKNHRRQWEQMGQADLQQQNVHFLTGKKNGCIGV